MTHQFEVSADIRYLDGALRGLVIPAGFRVKVPSMERARSMAFWLNGIRGGKDFARAVLTGNRYEVVSEPAITPLA